MIFLVGMPGSGKTYWGGVIAMMKGISFIDLDEYIETKEQRSIADFFKEHDEKAFREIEKTYLASIIENNTADTIIACGGGTPCYMDNMNLMKQNGVVIYLKTGTSFLMDRLKGHIDKRPLLTAHTDLNKRLETLLTERAPIYEQAHHILQVDYITPATFDEILKNV